MKNCGSAKVTTVLLDLDGVLMDHRRAGTSTWQDQRRNRLRDVLPLLGEPVGTDDELDAVFASGYFPAYERAWRSYDDAAPALAALRAAGYRLAVLTNGSEVVQLAKLRTIGLLDAVGPVFAADAIGARKPDPAAFRIVCGRLGVAPDTVLYVGDEYDVDVLGARSAGLRAVLLDRLGAATDEEESVIHSLAELMPV